MKKGKVTVVHSTPLYTVQRTEFTLETLPNAHIVILYNEDLNTCSLYNNLSNIEIFFDKCTFPTCRCPDGRMGGGMEFKKKEKEGRGGGLQITDLEVELFLTVSRF